MGTQRMANFLARWRNPPCWPPLLRAFWDTNTRPAHSPSHAIQHAIMPPSKPSGSWAPHWYTSTQVGLPYTWALPNRELSM